MAVGGGRSNRHSSRQQQQPPPLPFESSANAPIRVYPPDAFRASAVAASPLMQTLQSVNKPVPVVGILSTSYDSSESAYAFANRLIGKYAFHASEMAAACTATKDLSPLLASVYLYFDDTKPCVYLLGIARSESQCFDRDATDADVAAFERERFKLQLIMHSCCNMLFVLQENPRVSMNLLKEVRALASEKQQVLTQLSSSSSSSSSKGSKKGGSSGGGPSGSLNPFAPGRCVPLVLYVVPAPEEVLSAVAKNTSRSPSKSRSPTVAYCKAFETKLTTLFKSVRGGAVGSLRMRDVLTSTNLSKERRMFNVDPSHCAVIVSARSATEEGRLEARLNDLLESIELNDDDDEMNTDEEEMELDTLLQPLEDDDTGFPRAVQYLNRFVDLLLASTGSMAPAASSSSGSGGGGGKESIRIELLTLAHWLKAFHSLVKTMHRMETKRKQDTAAASAGALHGNHQVYQYDQSDYPQ